MNIYEFLERAADVADDPNGEDDAQQLLREILPREVRHLDRDTRLVRAFDGCVRPSDVRLDS